jgi:hypothetical protein
VRSLQAIRAAAVRGVRIEQANAALTRVWPWTLAAAFIVALVWELSRDLRGPDALALLALCLGLNAAAWLAGFSRRPHAGLALLLLEGRAGTQEQLVTALALGGQSGILAEAQRARAQAVASGLRPGVWFARPFRGPRYGLLLLLAGALAGLSWNQRPEPQPEVELPGLLADAGVAEQLTAIGLEAASRGDKRLEQAARNLAREIERAKVAQSQRRPTPPAPKSPKPPEAPPAPQTVSEILGPEGVDAIRSRARGEFGEAMGSHRAEYLVNQALKRLENTETFQQMQSELDAMLMASAPSAPDGFGRSPTLGAFRGHNPAVRPESFGNAGMRASNPGGASTPGGPGGGGGNLGGPGFEAPGQEMNTERAPPNVRPPDADADRFQDIGLSTSRGMDVDAQVADERRHALQDSFRQYLEENIAAFVSGVAGQPSEDASVGPVAGKSDQSGSSGFAPKAGGAAGGELGDGPLAPGGEAIPLGAVPDDAELVATGTSGMGSGQSDGTTQAGASGAGSGQGLRLEGDSRDLTELAASQPMERILGDARSGDLDPAGAERLYSAVATQMVHGGAGGEFDDVMRDYLGDAEEELAREREEQHPLFTSYLARYLDSLMDAP